VVSSDGINIIHGSCNVNGYIKIFSKKFPDTFVHPESIFNSDIYVIIIRLTEKQYANITYLTGGPDNQEKIVGTNCHVMV